MEQTENSRPDRGEDGRFLPGNQMGNRWKPGETGNPNGRRGAIRDLLNNLLDSPFNEDYTRREVLSLSLFEQAMLGNIAAIRELLDRAEGKPLTRLEVTEGQEYTEAEIEAAAKAIVGKEKNEQ